MRADLSAFPPLRSGGGGPPKAVEGARDGRDLDRPLHHSSDGPPPPSLRDRGGYGAALIAALLLILLATLTPTLAVTPDEMLKDPALETRARALSEELRCMVCQNESIDDSDAELAHDIRVLLRERLAAGDSDGQVIDFLVARYGEFILLKPRFNWHTALLWAAPPAVLVIGGIVAFGLFRRRRAGETVTLSAAERARVEELMARRE